MGKKSEKDLWLQETDSRQRNIVFPDTVRNEAQFWRNIGNNRWSASTKVGLFILAASVFGFIAAILVAASQQGVLWRFLLGMLFFCGTGFALIRWATRRSLRNLEKTRHHSSLRKP